jgi:hypothetical protein
MSHFKIIIQSKVMKTHISFLWFYAFKYYIDLWSLYIWFLNGPGVQLIICSVEKATFPIGGSWHSQLTEQRDMSICLWNLNS